MKKHKNITVARYVLLLVNFLVIVFTSTIIFATTKYICENDKAREFLETVKYVPMTPWLVPVITVSLFLVLVCLNIAREHYFCDRQSVVFFLCFVELLLCILITFFLNIGYKGILLLPIAGVIMHIKGTKRKFIFVVCAVIIYMALDYDIYSIWFNMCSLNDYILYYNANMRLYLFSIRNVLTSLCEILFILLLVFILQEKTDETDRFRSLYAQISKSEQDLRLVNLQLEEYALKSEKMAQAKERNRMAQEIHDTLGHTLTSISTGVDACIELIQFDKDKTKLQLERIASVARNGILDVRRSVSALRPDALKRFALESALRKMSDEINQLTPTRVNLNIIGDLKCSSDEEEVIYRVVQESITNAVRHGSATRIDVNVKSAENQVNIHIADNGCGCTEIEEGFGLRHMTERIRMLGGSIRFDGKNGFVTDVVIPIRWGEKV